MLEREVLIGEDLVSRGIISFPSRICCSIGREHYREETDRIGTDFR
ncbi:MAG TPA: hypothetical protein VLH56_04340 [Dissulfurispiraceae bacterium]|nr:hypothetical protein [Dissulfurispiraceae bacterium]